MTSQFHRNIKVSLFDDDEKGVVAMFRVAGKPVQEVSSKLGESAAMVLAVARIDYELKLEKPRQ